MLVLVDFDNIPPLERTHGILNIVDRVITRLDENSLAADRIDFKFYGGWYDERNLTVLAQKLATEIAANFPRPHTRIKEISPITVTASLAHSLEALPKHILGSTYRVRETPPRKKFHCPAPTTVGCTRAETCPLHHFRSFLTRGLCPESTCRRDIDPFFAQKREQKLVDSMIVADLIFAAHRQDREIVVVSSDDDVWPGIISAMSLGTHVVHIETRNSERDQYRVGVPGNYSTFKLVA